MADTQIDRLVDEIARTASGLGRIALMEICGTHTVALFRSGVRSLLPSTVRMISGPGCPVCVTSQGYIDAACELAGRAGVMVCTYGDMVRVPGGRASLEQLRAAGADVLVVYSAREALRAARENPGRKVVFLAVGFETTAPATAAAVMAADRAGIGNFLVMPGHKLVVPAVLALLAGGDVPIDGLLCPGHVSVIIGAAAYRPIVERHARPCVVAGFEPANMLMGILHLLRQAARRQADVENVYGVAVSEAGNAVAQRWIAEVFQHAAAVWRAMGTIPASGLELRDRYRRFDAMEHFGLEMGADQDPPGCRCGQVIQGKVEPPDCPLFGRQCTPLRPVGPCMVSSEGACAVWHKYAAAGGSRS